MAPTCVGDTNGHSEQCSSSFHIPSEKAVKPGTQLANAILKRDVYNPDWSRDLYYDVAFEHGNAEERLGQAIVVKTWDTFCSAIQQDVLNRPSSELIFSYIDTMAMHARDVVDGKPGPSLTVVEKVLSTLVELLTFRHRDVNTFYNEHAKLRIKIHLDQLVRHNMLVNGPWHKDFGAEVCIDERFFITQISRGLQPMEDGTSLWQRLKTSAAERRYLSGAYPPSAPHDLTIDSGRLIKVPRRKSLTFHYWDLDQETDEIEHGYDLRTEPSPSAKRKSMDSSPTKRGPVDSPRAKRGSVSSPRVKRVKTDSEN
ncbi:MAG: hypothetical protein Q9174_001930 [Haloplaca sp. 1 TL-2023]